MTGTNPMRKVIYIVLAGILFFLPTCKRKPAGEVKEVIFEVYPGESTKQIAARLDSLVVIPHPRRFVTQARLKGLDRTLQTGTYRLHTFMNSDSVLVVLASGAIATTTVTIPEGLTLTQVAERLAGAGVVSPDSFLDFSKDKRLLSEFNVPFESIEGMLFPDTYKFPVGISTERAIRMMLNRFFEIADPYLRDAGLDTLVILASIVEREAYLDEERAVVASVFWNRLRKGMAFESCATIEYVLPEHKERLTYADLRIDSPYNTYLHAGLPPGPICSPGKASLEAVARPKRTEYLYFVSKGDGSHHFSKTAAEHERMRRKINNAKNE